METISTPSRGESGETVCAMPTLLGRYALNPGFTNFLESDGDSSVLELQLLRYLS